MSVSIGFWVLMMACGGDSAAPTAAEQPAAREEAAPAAQRMADGHDASAKEAPLTLDSPITNENWKDHPYVVKVRGQVEGIEKNQTGGPSHSFPEGCGEEGILKVGLVEGPYADAESSEGPVQKYYVHSAGGDQSREVSAYYDEGGAVIFAFSVLVHEGSGSKAVSRVYYRDGQKLFEPPQEVTAGERGSVEDSYALADNVPATPIDAFHAMSGTAQKCQ